MIMNPLLNEDIFTLIYSHIFDFHVLWTTAIAVAAYKHHPLRDVLLRRLLQLPLRLSSQHLDDSKALIDHFARNDARANLVRDVVVVLGPLKGYWTRPSELKQTENADVLTKLLPRLLGRTENLRRLDWSRFPSPGRDILEELLDHSLISHISIDCAWDLGIPGLVTTPPDAMPSE